MKVLNKESMQDMVGQELGVSDWIVVDQDSINLFADVTKDHQYIHVDPEKAAQTPFKKTIAHGFLSLSMLSYFAENGCGAIIENAKMAINYGFDKVRFIQAVTVDSHIRGRSTLLSVIEKAPGQYLFKQTVVVEIKGNDKPALIADWLTLFVL